MAVSRRGLDRRFRDRLGRSPHEEIVRVQVQRACELLTRTDLPLAKVAELAGFRHPEYLSAVFRREVGVQPREYRKQAQPAR